MPIYNIFSRRKALAEQGSEDVYSYDSIPNNFRVQFVHIMNDALGVLSDQDALEVPSMKEMSGYSSYHYTSPQELIYENYVAIVGALCREYGLFHLTTSDNPCRQLAGYFLQTQEVDHCIDIIEITLTTAVSLSGNYDYERIVKPKLKAAEAIAETNARLKQHSIGYQYEAGQILRVDNLYQHAEIIKPALLLLSDKRFAGANDEFLKAHEYYRKGETKEALTNAAKCLESTLKIICAIKKWPVDPNATAKALIEKVFAEGLIPLYLQSQFASLRSLLESGAPTIRNKESAHGQGAEVKTVPPHLAQLGINVAASFVAFLVDSLDA
jgi:hypothetical protein